MRRVVGGISLLVLATAVTAPAQTVQLPSFSTFSVDTTVLVPDRGAVSLGGNSRAATSSNSLNGVPRQRGVGINRQAAGQQVTATIHDQREADAALLGEKGALRDKPGETDRIRAAESVPASVQQLERRRLAAESANQGAALVNYEKGRQAQAAGKSSVAAVYYRLAAKQADSALRQKIDMQLRAIAAAPTGGKRATPTARRR
jgi:hypothetical protein